MSAAQPQATTGANSPRHLHAPVVVEWAHGGFPGVPLDWVEPLSAGPVSSPPQALGASEGRVWPLQLTEDEVDALLEQANVPPEWRHELKVIGWCESKWSPRAVGDGGNSLGLWQMWTGWAREGEDLLDALTNARVAARVRAYRGRFGGGGGWTCADLWGIE